MDKPEYIPFGKQPFDAQTFGEPQLHFKYGPDCATDENYRFNHATQTTWADHASPEVFPYHLDLAGAAPVRNLTLIAMCLLSSPTGKSILSFTPCVGGNPTWNAGPFQHCACRQVW